MKCLLLLLLASGPSGSLSGGARPQYLAMGATVEASSAAAEPLATLEAPADGTVTRLHWEVITPGTDDGAGPDSFTVAVTADGTPICSATVACTTASGSGSGVDCEGAFTAGQDLHVEVTAEACATLPVLRASTTLRL